MARKCPERMNDQPHCYHASSPPFQPPMMPLVFFPTICCFCAPGWVKLDIVVPPAPAEEFVELQMMHGPGVEFQMGKKASGLVQASGPLPPTALRGGKRRT